MIWQLFYNTVIIPLGWTVFQILRLFDRKVRRGIRGRKGLFDRLTLNVAKLPEEKKRIWFHSSSLGEFEQAKPIIQGLKQRFPDIQIIVSFFSPSGYDHSRSYKYANLITYMPFDSRKNAARFIDIIKPTLAIMVRYDIWPNHVWALRKAGVPILIANATLRSNTARRFPVIRQFHESIYRAFECILTVSESDKQAFETFGLREPRLVVIGDTRYDQVWQRSAESKTRRIFPPHIVEDKKVLVIGSSWQGDEDVLLPAILKLVNEWNELLVVLVPHEPNVENLERIEQELNGNVSYIRFSNLNDYKRERLIIIDSVGILMALYQYAAVAYVGGGFGAGVHNVLEPAVYGVPIMFGPKHDTSQEAVLLVKEGAAFSGATSEDFLELLNALFRDSELRQRAGEKAFAFVKNNIGATDRFLSYVEKIL